MKRNWIKSWPAWVWIGTLAIFALSTILTSCTQLFAPPRQGWNKSFGPVVPHDKFPTDCAICHEGGNWTTIRKDFTFDHEARTGVPLKGAHARVACLMCHNDRGPVATFAAQGCAGCHVDPHHSQLGHACTDCHQEQSWVPVEQIAKHNRTRFPLIGAHAAAACFTCHSGAQVGNFKGADTTCITCHQTDLARAKSPDHIAQNWTTDCQHCHTPTGWQPALFKHPAAFPLTGGHAGVACTVCHKGGVFTALPTDCASCHLALYQNTTNPNHIASGFSTNCASCHNTTTWFNARFNHTSAFPLTGGHAGLSCSNCHKGGVFTGLSTDCVTCHLGNYQKTTNPNHTTAGFGTNCASCHTTKTWQGAVFNHTFFPITSGPHRLACSECHTNSSNYAMYACTNCHTHSQSAMNSKHREVRGYTWASPACLQCHPKGRAED